MKEPTDLQLWGHLRMESLAIRSRFMTFHVLKMKEATGLSACLGFFEMVSIIGCDHFHDTLTSAELKLCQSKSTADHPDIIYFSLTASILTLRVFLVAPSSEYHL